VLGYAVTSVRFLLALVLAAAVVGKVRDAQARADFARTLRVGLRVPGARLVADSWLVVEGVTALALVWPPTAGYAAVLAVLVFGCLTAGTAVLVAQDRDFDCNCFGSGRSALSRWTVLRNGALTVAALLSAACLPLPAARASAPVMLAAALTVLTGAVLAGLAWPLRALVGQLRPPAARPLTRGSALPGGGRR
jgi:hypothetical protein